MSGIPTTPGELLNPRVGVTVLVQTQKFSSEIDTIPFIHYLRGFSLCLWCLVR